MRLFDTGRYSLNMVQLESERLLLREFLKSDFDAVHEYARDPEVVKYMEWGPNQREETRRFIDIALAWQKEPERTIYEFAVLLKPEEILIGACGIRISPGDPELADIGYCYNRIYWQKGYAAEAARSLIDFGFEKLGLRRIVATCDTENRGSSRVMEKIGMRREGHFIEDKKIKGAYRNTYLYAILLNEWNSNK